MDSEIEQSYDLLKNISKNSVIYILGDFASKGINFLLIPLYTSMVSTSDYGVVSVLTSLTSFLAIFFSFQLSSMITINYYKLDTGERRRLIYSVTLLSLVISVVFAVLLALFGRGIFDHFLQDIPFIPYILLAICTAVFYGPVDILKANLRIQEKSVRYALLVSSQAVIQVALTLLFLIKMDMGGLGIVMAIFLAYLVVGTVSAGVLLYESRGEISTVYLQEAIIISAPIVLHMLSHWGLNLMDRFILQYYVPLSQVGIYQLGYQVGMIYQVLIISVNNAWTPFFFQKIEQEEYHATIRSLANWLVLFQLALASGIVLFKEELFTLFIDPSYRQAISIVPWVVLGYVFVTFYHMWVNILFSQKQTKLIPIATILAVITNFVINILLVPRYGIHGSAIATAVSYAILAGVVFLVSSKVSSFRYELGKWGKVFITGLLIVIASRQLHIENIAISVLVKLLLAACWPLLLYLMRYWNSEDTQFIKNVFTNIRRDRRRDG